MSVRPSVIQSVTGYFKQRADFKNVKYGEKLKKKKKIYGTSLQIEGADEKKIIDIFE